MTRARGGGEPGRLAVFLLDRLADDEDAARSALTAAGFAPVSMIEQVVDHAARHDPVRVLREVAAKRAVVRMWFDGADRRAFHGCAVGEGIMQAVIARLAAVYADHPDFDPRWLPSDAEPEGSERGSAPLDHDLDRPDNVIAFPRGVPGRSVGEDH